MQKVVVVVVEMEMAVARLDSLDRQYIDQPSGENFINRRIWNWDM
jgi:hypothetical protein